MRSAAPTISSQVGTCGVLDTWVNHRLLAFLYFNIDPFDSVFRLVNVNSVGEHLVTSGIVSLCVVYLRSV